MYFLFHSININNFLLYNIIYKILKLISVYETINKNLCEIKISSQY